MPPLAEIITSRPIHICQHIQRTAELTNRLPRHTQSRPSHAPFYTSRMSHGGRRRFADAGKLEGISQETAIIRLRLNQIMINHPNDHALFFKTIQLLIRAVSAQTSISKGAPQPSEQLIENILRDVGLKLGLKAIPWPRD